jgi:LPS-assembly protein
MTPFFRRKPLAVLICCGFAGSFAGGLVLETQAAEPLRVDPVLLGLPPIKPAEAPLPAKPAAAEVKPVQAPTLDVVPIAPIAPALPVAEEVVVAPSPVVVPAPKAAKAPKASPEQIPARAVAPQPPPAVLTPSPVPAPAQIVSPVVALPARDPGVSEREASSVQKQQAQSPAPVVTPLPAPAVVTTAAVAPVIATAVNSPNPATVRTSGGAMAPLRVDPALLGAPPVVAARQLAPVRSEVSPVPVTASAAAVAATAVATNVTNATNTTAPKLAAPSEILPPLVASSGLRDEEEVPSDLTPALALRSATKLVAPPSKSEVSRPAFLSAEKMSGTTDREAIAEGAAQLRKIGTVVDADRLTYWPIDDELEAVGNVRLEQGDDVMTGPKMRLKLEDQVGYFEQPAYFIRRESVVKPTLASGFPTSVPLRKTTEGHGQADRIDFEGQNQIRLTNATYTTCKPGNDDWYATASDLKLDYDREEANGGSGTVYFKGVPILYAPWMSFSLNNNRKSGLLAPTFGSTSNSGIELTLPYYWNIAPNMDATIAPRVLSKRGTQLGSEFRYLDASFTGEVRAEILQADKIANRDRYGFSLLHTQNLSRGFSGLINYSRVSDDTYFTDLSSRITNTAQTQLRQQGMLTYSGGGWWNATANVQSYQTLQPDPNNPVTEPYRLLPQITVNARQPDLYRTDSSFLGQFSAFTNPTLSLPEARRTVLYPQLAVPFVTPGWYVTPKVGVHATYYAFNRQAAGTPDSLDRTLPVFSIDSGMTFERPSNWFGSDYTQTLEPRLFYLNIPYRDQSKIPIFDSGLADFNFAQIFSENQFSGQDRINDADQLTAAVTTRLIDPASGSERIRAMVGQRFYFSPQQVTLGTQAQRTWNRSDFLAAFSGQVLPKVYADVATQYNTINGAMERTSFGGRYVPEPGKVLNAAYRFNRDLIKQVDFSAQWPIGGGWHLVGRSNYSIKDKAPIENIAGLEYNGGCWVVRVVGQRLATTSGTAASAVFVQLELSDFSQIGSNPLDLLKRSIQGYGRVNQPTADPVFGQ